MLTVVDTGPLVAAADVREDLHSACRDWLAKADPRLLVVPALVLAEACHLLGTRCGARVEAEFLRSVAAGEAGTVLAPTKVDLERGAELVERYASLPLGGTDAVVMAIAERLGTTQVATLDHRHFRVVQLRLPVPLVLLPE